VGEPHGRRGGRGNHRVHPLRPLAAAAAAGDTAAGDTGAPIAGCGRGAVDGHVGNGPATRRPVQAP